MYKGIYTYTDTICGCFTALRKRAAFTAASSRLVAAGFLRRGLRDLGRRDTQRGDELGPLRCCRGRSLRLGLGRCVGAHLRCLLLLCRLGGSRPQLLRLPLLPRLPRVSLRRRLKLGTGVHAASGAPGSSRRSNDGGGSNPLERKRSPDF